MKGLGARKRREGIIVEHRVKGRERQRKRGHWSAGELPTSGNLLEVFVDTSDDLAGREERGLSRVRVGLAGGKKAAWRCIRKYGSNSAAEEGEIERSWSRRRSIAATKCGRVREGESRE